jgi:hypothetical protein
MGVVSLAMSPALLDDISANGTRAMGDGLVDGVSVIIASDTRAERGGRLDGGFTLVSGSIGDMRGDGQYAVFGEDMPATVGKPLVGLGGGSVIRDDSVHDISGIISSLARMAASAKQCRRETSDGACILNNNTSKLIYALFNE